MSQQDWTGPRSARKALSRLHKGLPAFPYPARNAAQMSARRRAIQFLFDEGFIVRGPKGPVLTQAGLDEFKPTLRSCDYSDSELSLIRTQYRKLGASALARRLGRSVIGIRRAAWRHGAAGERDTSRHWLDDTLNT